MFFKTLLFFKQENMDTVFLLFKKVFCNFWLMGNSKNSLNHKTVFLMLFKDLDNLPYFTIPQEPHQSGRSNALVYG